MADLAKTISKEGIVLPKYFTNTDTIAKNTDDAPSKITPFISLFRIDMSVLIDQTDDCCCCCRKLELLVVAVVAS